MGKLGRLPLIVGFGGFNAAGRSSGHVGYKRMIFESLNQTEQTSTIRALASMMGKIECEDDDCFQNGKRLDDVGYQQMADEVLAGTLIRRIESHYFPVDKAPFAKSSVLQASEDKPITLRMSVRDLPSPLPYGWTVKTETSDFCEVELWKSQPITIETEQDMPVKAAGQLPSGFNPAALYRSTHHPRGLQLSVIGASDAVLSMGVSWQEVMKHVSPDQVGVYSSSVMSQLDHCGFGGMLQARNKGSRVTSKQLALGLNSMPADFINAYVLGSVGVTGGITGACATFLYNLRAGVDDIKSGKRRVVVVGSSEAPIMPEIIDGYAAMSALATDADLRKLDGLGAGDAIDYRRASRPFGDNCGFTLAESGQYVVLMDDELAVELGANIYGAVPGVFVNADGFKKSISSPGPGNYITMAKAVGLAQSLLGETAIKTQSFVQAHGSSTPQNRMTESKIFDVVAKGFGIDSWPVAAVKAYLGHSLGPASGDQMMASLGVFEYGILPGIKTIDKIADDVSAERLSISSKDQELGKENAAIAFLNSKGFGGNNATATVFSGDVVKAALKKRLGDKAWSAYERKHSTVHDATQSYLELASRGQLKPIYQFGSGMIDEDKISLDSDSLSLSGSHSNIDLSDDDGLGKYFK